MATFGESVCLLWSEMKISAAMFFSKELFEGKFRPQMPSLSRASERIH